MSQSGSSTAGGGGGGTLNTLTGNTGGAVGPSAGNINVIGSGGVTVTGNPGTNTLTITSSGGGGGITTLDGDSGSATGSTVTIHGGSNISTTATAATVTVNLDNTVSISGSMTAGTGFIATTGDVNIVAGNIDLPATSSGFTEGTINVGGAPALYMYNGGTYLGLGVGNSTTAGIDNVAIGSGCMVPVTGAGNVGVGTESFNDLLGGNDNTGIGQFSLSGLTTGSHNVALGFNSGALYLSSESSNICIGTLGVTGDNTTIRIGDPATQTSAFMAGAYGVTPSMSINMMTIGSDGQLGSQAIPGGGGGITTLDGDSGSATGSAVTIAGGSNITTSATSATVTVDLDSTVSISGSMTAGTGFVATTGDVSIAAGNLDLPATDTIATQGVITINGTRFLSSDGVTGTGVCVGTNAGNTTVDMGSSVAIGSIALANVDGSGGSNVAVGANSLTTLTSGSTNSAVGFNSLLNLVSGNFNIGIGDNAGSAYTSSESFNIVIGTTGSIGESNVMRLGDNGVLTATFIGGAYGATPAMSPQMAIIGSDGQMGSQAIPSGGFTWSEQTGTTQAMAVNNGYILNNSGGVVATLPASAAVGTTMRIAGKGSGGWTLQANGGQTIQYGNMVTSSGGTIVPFALPADQYSALEILCITTDTVFEVISSVGNFTLA